MLRRLYRYIVGGNKEVRRQQNVSITINIQGGINMIYDLLKQMISTGNFQKADLQNKLNIFFAVEQLSQAQYTELTEALDPKKAEVK